LKTQPLVVATLIVLMLSAAVSAASPGPASGKQSITFTQRSPLRTIEEFKRRSEFVSYEASREPQSIEYDVTTEPFEVFVPPNYAKNGPAFGLFFWSGVTEFSPSWFDVLARHRIIWVSAPSVAKRPGLIGMGLPIDAVHNMKRLYNIDENRVYIGGFSAGGLFTAQVIHAFPDVYRGAFFINGEDFYNNSHWDEHGEMQPGVTEYPKWGGPLSYEQLKAQVRLAILTGEKDPVFEADISRKNFEALVLDGFRRVSYFEIPRGGHNHPDDSWFERGIDALDRPPDRTPPTTGPTRDSHPSPGQVAQAKRLLSTAQELLDGPNATWGARFAPKYLQQVIEDYPTTPSAALAKELLEWTKRNPPPPPRRMPATRRATTTTTQASR
jgi:predicted esterase